MTGWSEAYERDIRDFSNWPVDVILMMQLRSWINVYNGENPPDNFFEVMDEASKISGVFLPRDCKEKIDLYTEQRKKLGF